MTRYARAKGSKASNERLPNDATPWSIMKQQLEIKQDKPDTLTKSKSAKELLQEKEKSLNYSTASVNSSWAEFEESRPKEKQQDKDHNLKTTKVGTEKKHNKRSEGAILKQTALNNINTDGIEKQLKNDKHESTSNASPKQKLKRKFSEDDSNHTTSENGKSNKQKSFTADQNVDTRSDEHILSKAKKKGEKDAVKRNSNDAVNTNANAQADKSEAEGGENSQMKKRKKFEPKQSDAKNENSKFEGRLSKRQKRNIKMKERNAKDSTAFNVIGNNWKNSVEFNQTEGPEESQNNAETGNEPNESAGRFVRIQKPPNFSNRTNKFGKRNLNHMKPPKVRDDKEHKRRKPEVPMRMMINGREVELVRYDGYPIKKEDAERLKDLKQKMIMKGIPKSEIDIAMKLERRKAEKALARDKKNVCFHCRKSGHNLSECPELENTETGTGICFKCGSTEHTHFECRVTKRGEYRYATCFICREQGHVAKQCPDNPKGIYPRGGACKLCGDVTHLKKDCPDLIQQKEETAVTLGTISGDALESLDGVAATNKNTIQRKSLKQKIIKF